MSTATATAVPDTQEAVSNPPVASRGNTGTGGLPQRITPAGIGSIMSSQSAVPVLVVAAAFIAISVAAFLWASGPTYQVLFSNISEADGGAILAELDRRGVPYKFSAGGQAIMVPSDVVHPLRLQLAEQGLPKGGDVGFELLDNQSFGVSQFTEQINYQRGLEGELGRSMEALGPVASARVHLAMAKPSVFVQQRVPTKASVILNLHNGRTLSETQVNAIVHLIASSVADLAAENVSVVDQRGELLSQAKSGLKGLDNTQLKYTREIETSMQERVANILSPILGKDNFRVQVNAQVDFSTVEETQEAYSPNQNTDQVAVRSSQSSSNFSGDEASARGIPGALSNTAPNWAPSPIDATDADQDTGANAEDSATGNLQSAETVNYELDRNIRHIRHQMGAVERLSVAVVVNDRPGLDEEGNPILEPVPEDELEEINRLVQQAVGFSAARGDRVEVINSPFKPVVTAEVPTTPWWKDPMVMDLGASILRWLAVAMLILLGYRLIVRPLLHKHLGPNFIPGNGPLAALPGAGNMILAEDGNSDRGDTSDGNASGQQQAIPFKRVDKSASYSEQLEELKRISHDDPRMIAMIVRNWVKEDV